MKNYYILLIMLLFLSRPDVAITACSYNSLFFSIDATCVHTQTCHAPGNHEKARCYREYLPYPSSMQSKFVNSILSDAASTRSTTSTTSHLNSNKTFDQPGGGTLIFGKLNLLNIGLRARFSSLDIIGSKPPEEFQEYDLGANFKLPWEWYFQSGWGFGTRLMTSLGVLHAAGKTGLVVSLIPLVTFGSHDGRYSIDMGMGAALFSRQTFGEQDYGGPFQFALTAGAGIPLFKKLGLGYRYQHYSDAGFYGPESAGADFHMIELIYRF